MVEQARILVLKAVAAATKTQVPTALNESAYTSSAGVSKQQQTMALGGLSTGPALPPKAAVNTSKSLASFRSALNLKPTSTERTPQLQKARCSALRLNNILHGNGDESSDSKVALGMRKVRSVRWDTPGELPTLSKISPPEVAQRSKKSRSPHEAAKLKSFKSFGRPHAGDFGSGPRNATFGEFGGRSTGMWGRDGRMAAHPTPLKDATLRDPLSGEFHGADKNATFNIQQATASSTRNRPSIHLASVDGSTLPRTATALESLLLKKSMN